MRFAVPVIFAGLFLLASCAGSSGGGQPAQLSAADEKAKLDETRNAAEAAVQKVHELELEKARLEAEKSGKAQ